MCDQALTGLPNKAYFAIFFQLDINNDGDLWSIAEKATNIDHCRALGQALGVPSYRITQCTDQYANSFGQSQQAAGDILFEWKRNSCDKTETQRRAELRNAVQTCCITLDHKIVI